MDIEIVGVADAARWRELAALSGLPSHAWGYAHALEATGIAPKLAHVRAGDERMLLPFHERRWRGHVDIATYLATAGAWMPAPSAAPLVAWREFAARQGWVAGYLQLATDFDLGPDAEGTPGEVVDLNEWFVLDLASVESPADFSTLIRRKIVRAERAGVEIVEGGDALADALLRLHPQTRARVGASTLYDFPEATIRRWLEMPGTLVLGASLDGRIEAVTVFLAGAHDAEYHLPASSDAGRDFAAPLLWGAIRRLRARGVRRLHLGGGVSRGDGLHAFKQRFHPEARPLRALRQVYDAEVFGLLCDEAGVPAAGGRYFPPYRATAG